MLVRYRQLSTMLRLCAAILVALVAGTSTLSLNKDSNFAWASTGNSVGDNSTTLNRVRRTGIVDKRKLWPDATMPYVIEKGFSPSELRYIQAAINDIQQLKCVHIKKRTTQRNYVIIQHNETVGCWSWIGMIGGPQKLFLSKDSCFYPESAKGTVIHELLHAFGFFHEHTHPDRDKYVKILTHNISPGMENNFKKLERKHATDFNVGYDLSSVMHYPWNGHAVNPNLRTILPIKNPNAAIGQRNALSPKDIRKLKLMYNC